MHRTAPTPPPRASRSVSGRRSRPRTGDVDPREHGTGRFAKKHGARSLARHLAAGSIDGRSWIGRTLREIRTDLAADAGGDKHLTARERLLIDRCAAVALICMTMEAHVFSEERAIDDAGELLPILKRGYVQHVQSLARMLQALGLRPDKVERLPDLSEYLEHRERERQAGASAEAAPSPVGDADTPEESDA